MDVIKLVQTKVTAILGEKKTASGKLEKSGVKKGLSPSLFKSQDEKPGFFPLSGEKEL